MQSFRHAGAGIATTLATQANARIQLGVALLVVGLGGLLDLSAGDWCWLVAAIAMVFAAECMNTALESLADASVPDPARWWAAPRTPPPAPCCAPRWALR